MFTLKLRTVATIAVLGGAALLPLGVSPLSAGAAGSEWTGGPVTIRVELDLPVNGSDGPLVQQVVDVIPGDQVELTSADIFDNPSTWGGTLLVDIDPVTATVRVSTGQVPTDEGAAPLTSPVTGIQDGYVSDYANFETAVITITGGGFDSFTLVTDELWLSESEPSATMNLVGVSAANGDARAAWQSEPVALSPNLADAGLAVFAYGFDAPTDTTVTTVTAAPTSTAAPTTTLAPAPPAAAPVAQPVAVTPTYTG